MQLSKTVLMAIATYALLFAIPILIPAALLYPLALWMSKHTELSGRALSQIYVVAIILLFFLTLYLASFISYLLELRRRKKSPGPTEDSHSENI
jgi:hypothetical protein